MSLVKEAPLKCIVGYCREQGRHRGHLYIYQNCTVQDDNVSLLLISSGDADLKLEFY